MLTSVLPHQQGSPSPSGNCRMAIVMATVFVHVESSEGQIPVMLECVYSQPDPPSQPRVNIAQHTTALFPT